ncbi:MAG: hypothetical protein OEZ01_00585 [Candidatus Heimdallarchaeota archaeon]|nr:hypothetical protein [Candidatus Heimdallarchaeota archaeon]MDH5676609.1 hypothetical protein [Myxococcales bacterium]
MTGSKPNGPEGAEWTDRRWHVAGNAIHAGDGMEIRARFVLGEWDDEAEAHRDLGPGPWLRVRIESENQGARLVAYRTIDGLLWRCNVGPEHEIRWP